MLNYKIKIGLAPCRRWLPGKRPGIFNPDYAISNKKAVIPFIKENFSDDDTEFIDLDFLNEEGLMYDISQAQTIADKFIAEKVDALFIINCNFGCEEVACKLAKLVGKPTLIWAPRDNDNIFEPDGTRYTDAQCGLFAISKGLQRLGVPFTHIENCNKDAPVFKTEFDKFLSVVTMVKNFKTLRIGQVGSRPKPFNSVMCNEDELLQKFGIEIVPINMAVAKDAFERILIEKEEELKADVRDFNEKFNVISTPAENQKRMMAFKYFYREICKTYSLSVISTECWTSMAVAVGVLPCCAMSYLADEGLIITCESDILACITMSLLSCASRGKSRPILGEFTVRNPWNENSELLWHCGPFALSLKKDQNKKADLYIDRPSFRLKDGRYTISRMDSFGDGKYQLLAGTCHTCEGPHTFGTHLWAEFDSYTKWEKKLIYGPYIHHVAEIEGDYTEVLEEFCKYIPNLEIDLVK